MGGPNSPLYMEAQALHAAANDILDPAFGPLVCFAQCGGAADCHHCGEIAGVKLAAEWLKKRADYMEALALGARMESAPSTAPPGYCPPSQIWRSLIPPPRGRFGSPGSE